MTLTGTMGKRVSSRRVVVGDVLSRWNGTDFVPVTVTGMYDAISGHYIISTTGGNVVTGFQGVVSLWEVCAS
jgi:hypothetical protein